MAGVAAQSPSLVLVFTNNLGSVERPQQSFGSARWELPAPLGLFWPRQHHSLGVRRRESVLGTFRTFLAAQVTITLWSEQALFC